MSSQKAQIHIKKGTVKSRWSKSYIIEQERTRFNSHIKIHRTQPDEEDENMPEENSANTNIENEKKSKEERGPCTGESCTIEMCRRCHSKSYECSASKVDGGMDENN